MKQGLVASLVVIIVLCAAGAFAAQPLGGDRGQRYHHAPNDKRQEKFEIKKTFHEDQNPTRSPSLIFS